MRRLNRTTVARLKTLERLAPPPVSFFHWDQIATDHAKEFVEKFGALPEGALIEDAGLSLECWADLIANMTAEGRVKCGL